MNRNLRDELERVRAELGEQYRIVQAVHTSLDDLFAVVGWGGNPYVEERVAMLANAYRQLREAVKGFDYFANHVDDGLRSEAWERVKAVVASQEERGA